MLFSWITIYDQLIRHSRNDAPDPMADPLDRPEWRGLWPIVALIATRRARRRRIGKRPPSPGRQNCACPDGPVRWRAGATG